MSEAFTQKDNAAARSNFVSDIYQSGVDQAKKHILSQLSPIHSELHKSGTLHIHDLEAYGAVYNCSMPNVWNVFTNKKPSAQSTHGKIAFVFSVLKDIIVNLGVSQTGGIGFLDFDRMISDVFNQYKIKYTTENKEFFSDCIAEFLCWINITRSRYCREPYYLTINLGLSVTDWGRETTSAILQNFIDSPIHFTRPNIVYKVNQEVNAKLGTRNYDLYQRALSCTAKRMIPTYLLTDSAPNMNASPDCLGIMGCRTRVMQNVNGEATCLGRGNIANVTINLPRIALENDDKILFYQKLNAVMESAHQILANRVELMKHNPKHYLNYVFENHLWVADNINDMIRHGTLSIGFIGLSETVEILTNDKYYHSDLGQKLAIEIIESMRKKLDEWRTNEQLNYSLLASPGEMVSGRFCEIDKSKFNHKVQQKGFYTNSFHVEVNSKLSLYDKIIAEAPFHSLCNGGCITYIEFQSALLKNILALEDAVTFATQQGISYLGFNYPMDICNKCGNVGTFDTCQECGSTDIKRIRRVSGYLEDLSYFTDGKKAEEKHRLSNI